MVIGRITVGTLSGEIDVFVEVLGKGPRPGTMCVRALNGLQPFTKFSHGGPFQDDTAVVAAPSLRDLCCRIDPLYLPAEIQPKATGSAEPVSIPAPPILAEDWFLESQYEDRTWTE